MPIPSLISSRDTTAIKIAKIKHGCGGPVCTASTLVELLRPAWRVVVADGHMVMLRQGFIDPTKGAFGRMRVVVVAGLTYSIVARFRSGGCD